MKLRFNIAAASATIALAGSAFAGPAEDLIAANKCAKCHTAKCRLGELGLFYEMSPT